MRLSATESTLLSESERKLVSRKGPWHVKALVKAIQRTRALRDKQADLLRRQTISTARSSGSKSDASGAANARTAAKGRLFERALLEFEAQLAAINAESSDAAKALLAGAPSRPAATVKRSAAKAAVAVAKPSKTAARSTTKAGTKAAKSAKAAKTAAAAKPKAVAKPDPKVSRPGKARIALPRTVAGPSMSQRAGQASRRSRTRKAR